MLLVWVYHLRPNCTHGAPMAYVPLVIRWGLDASSDLLRQRARCTKCGHKGSTLRHPSWIDSSVGVGSFPTDRMTT